LLEVDKAEMEEILTKVEETLEVLEMLEVLEE
jgi:hypothetical protein